MSIMLQGMAINFEMNKKTVGPVENMERSKDLIKSPHLQLSYLQPLI